MFFIVTNLINLKIKTLKIVYLFFCTLVFTFYSNSIFGQKKVNIACVGNGITYGIGVENRVKNNYPQQLQYLLGANYKVTNFGVVNAPVLSNGINSYSNTVAVSYTHLTLPTNREV